MKRLIQYGSLCGFLLFSIVARASDHGEETLTALEETIRQMQEEIAELKEYRDERQLQDMRQDANAQALTPDRDDSFRPVSFQGGERALQALNPELSATGDLGVWYLHQNGQHYSDSGRSGFFFRGLGIHLQSNLDPFSLFRAAFNLSPQGVHLGEAYIVWAAVIPRTTITVGQFRAQLGVVNRWHKHGLDSFDFPLMLQEPFGPAGLNQAGISVDVTLPPWWAHEQAITLQVTNSSNAKAFSGDFFSIPTSLLRLRSYWDIDRATYLDLGLTGVLGFSHKTGINVIEEDSTTTVVNEAVRLAAFAGADLTLSWEPPERSHYRGVTWRTEFLYGHKKMPDKEHISWMGGYTSLDVKVAQGWFIGARADLAQPFQLDNKGQYIWQAAPYLSWWPSAFVRLHLEYNAIDGTARSREHRMILQSVFAAGPHKHERY